MMNKQQNSEFSQELEARFGLYVVAGLAEHSQNLPHDISERLRFARERALSKAQSVRLVQAALKLAPGSFVVRSGNALAMAGGLGSPRWFKLASFLPMLLLVIGILLIQHGQLYEQIKAAAEIDTALLSGKLPLAAYSDPGFSEFLSDEQE